MCSGMGDRTCLLPGFPIRTSPDQSLVDSSPGLFAASHVLLRLLVPRHPPCALTNLATKMLASTVQFSSYGRAQLRTERRVRTPVRRSARSWSFARQARQAPRVIERAERARSVRGELTAPSGPNSVPGPIRRRGVPFPPLGGCTRKLRRRAGLLVSVPLHEPTSEHLSERGSGQQANPLPRSSLERR
jgi:hypothetical protein